mmetsp:Transcript_21003/g.29040  ORF Transcript_21003/g.29040 Transcript_21003/m.29040 type:complete len:105 (+) Transcript_21003:795-1109(+)
MIIDYLKTTKKNLEVIRNDDGSVVFTGWERQIERLYFNHMKISVIQNLDKFISLRKLKLLDNCISRIEGLEKCKILEELCLEKNKLTQIENLDHLKYLKKLDLG